MYYLASPMTNPAMKEQAGEFYARRNEKIANKLEQLGVKVYLPQRDTNQTLTPKKILAKNIEALKKAGAIIVVLSDSRGIYLEAGYAKGLGKTVVGLRVEETRNLGVISRNFFDYVVEDAGELAVLLKDLEKKNEV